MKLTPWFPETVKPMRVGVYQVKLDWFNPRDWYAYWNGKRFCYRSSTGPDDALRARYCETALPRIAIWRGLAEKPE